MSDLRHVMDLEDILTKRFALAEMSADLSAVGYAQDAARETEELLVLLNQWETRAGVRIDRLRSVWKAMDRWQDSNGSEPDFRAALAEYRGEPRQPEIDPKPRTRA